MVGETRMRRSFSYYYINSNSDLYDVMAGGTDAQDHQFAHLYPPLERAIKSMIEDELLPPSLRRTFFIMTASFAEGRARSSLVDAGMEEVYI